MWAREIEKHYDASNRDGIDAALGVSHDAMRAPFPARRPRPPACAAARRAGESGGIGKLHVAAADHLNGLLKLGGACFAPGWRARASS